MSYYDERIGAPLRDAVDRLVGDWDGVSRKRMFGCPCYSAGGKIFAIVMSDGLVLTKLPAAEAVRRGSPLPVAPFRTETKNVPSWSKFAVGPDDVAKLAAWIEEGYRAAVAETETGR
ncbi:TfoX/Sxy family protein [Paenibacillus sp.]|uniref:TfoX/Sxy family protein n=1 Tax=Paenibacillus sp. TaxID=58172 RepID=UPI002D4757C0|nr:TfoX/Sxy family protein [Paenibacillus sp.]HZG87857.1 TfoX/Sxy family protein [Paenibacillus sp.]